MCDLTQEFKLCSCNEENLPFDRIGWILERKNNLKVIIYKKGEPAINFLSPEEKNTAAVILQRLNASNCFDFDYQPKEDDFLQIKMQKTEYGWYAFRFVKGKWQEDDSTSFDEWRQKLDRYKNGKITS